MSKLKIYFLSRSTATLVLLTASTTAAQLSGTINLSEVGAGVPGVTFSGIAALDYSGRSVSSAGDVNGDGLDDFLIGARVEDSGGYAGETYLIYGSSSLPISFDLADADVTFYGIDSLDHSGSSVSSAGDVNGDGLADLLIGAPNAEPGGDNAGETYLVYGSASLPASFDLADADVIFNGIDAFDYSGLSVSSAGDVNGDGRSDLLIGAYGADSYAGETYLIYGRTSMPASFDVGSPGTELEFAL